MLKKEVFLFQVDFMSTCNEHENDNEKIYYINKT